MKNKHLVPSSLLFVLLAHGALGAQLTVRLGDLTAPPGATGFALPISFEVEPGTGPVMGWSMSLRYDPAALGKVAIENTREADFFKFNAEWGFVEPGTVHAACVYDLQDATGITAENDGPFANLRFCVLATAAPGTHLVEFLITAPQTLPGAGFEGSPLVCTIDGRSVVPSTEPGSVTVAGDPIAGDPCPPDDHVKPPPDPVEPRATYRLTGGEAVQGGRVTSTFLIEANAETQGFSVSIDFDEDVLRGTAVRNLWERPDGKPWGFQKFEWNNSRDMPGNGGIDEGFLVGAVAISLEEPVHLPADTQNEVLALDFQVSPDAPIGSTTELRFLDGGRGSGEPIKNIVVVQWASQTPLTHVGPIAVTGRLQIVPDISIFVRGDSNGDGTVNLSDAQTTLNYLFLGRAVPACHDAADANDDGTINIVDAIATLDWLFRGSRRLPPPGGEAGGDPTPDSLRCSHPGS
jgi:hypothetical protein